MACAARLPKRLCAFDSFQNRVYLAGLSNAPRSGDESTPSDPCKLRNRIRRAPSGKGTLTMELGKVLSSSFKPCMGIILSVVLAWGLLPADAVAEGVGGVVL